MENKNEFEEVKSCSKQYVLAINDTLNVMSGKWKLPIIGSLFYGKKRFKELEREISKITPRMLSKELKDLEMNGIIRRTVLETAPITVEYELTEAGHSFQSVLDSMLEWGLKHRKSYFENLKTNTSEMTTNI